MPKELTHWILAERALSGLGSESRLYRTVHQYRNEYLGGAVLPDTHLHLFKGANAKQALDAAARFHDTDANSYQPLIQAEASLQNAIPDPLLACMLGVISHMQADIVFHPYVYAMTGKDDIARHYQLETDIDVYFVSAGQSDCNRKLADIVTPETEKTLISVAELLFSSGGELPRQAISDALRLHIRFQAMYSSLFWKLAARLLGSLLGAPFSQQRHLFYPVSMNQKQIFDSLGSAVEWRHPVTGEINCSSVNDLADQAVKQTIEVFRRIEALQSLAAALSDPQGCNLITGMFAVNSSKMFASGSVGTFQTTNKNCKVSG